MSRTFELFFSGGYSIKNIFPLHLPRRHRVVFKNEFELRQSFQQAGFLSKGNNYLFVFHIKKHEADFSYLYPAVEHERA